MESERSKTSDPRKRDRKSGFEWLGRKIHLAANEKTGKSENFSGKRRRIEQKRAGNHPQSRRGKGEVKLRSVEIFSTINF